VFRGMMIHRKAWGFHAPSWFFGPRLKVGTTIVDPRYLFDFWIRIWYHRVMASNSVARVQKAPIQVSPDGKGGLDVQIDPNMVRLNAARLLAAGFPMRKVAISMKEHLSPTANEASAVAKLRKWMYYDSTFRDLIYEQAVLRLDLNSPDILDGVRRSARRGRVDAARFALELTGRHVKEESQVTQVNVVLNNIPRPE